MPLFTKNEKVDIITPEGRRQAARVIRPGTPGARGLKAMTLVKVTRKGHYNTGPLLARQSEITGRFRNF
jgi:hypothetical protein